MPRSSVAKLYPTIPIIAGGGIKTAEHVRQYKEAGAQHFSIATGCLHPVRTWWLISGYGRCQRDTAETMVRR